jgi:hypothetical protein
MLIALIILIILAAAVFPLARIVECWLKRRDEGAR